MPIETPDGNAIARATEHTTERLLLESRVQIPRGHLDRRLCHVVAAHRGERVEHLPRMFEFAAQHARREKLGDDVPRGFGRFAAVVGIRFGHAFAPPLLTLAVQRGQQERAVVAAPEARLEEADEWKPAKPKVESLDTQRCLPLDYTPARVAFRYIAIEGPIGVGKTRLAERLAGRLDGTTILEETENPFLVDFYNDRPGAALQAQLFFLLNRHRQLMALRQADLFQHTIVCDYLFDRDKIFAFLNLDDNELFIYQRLYDLLSRDVPTPDLVVYLQAPTEVLTRRIRETATDPERPAPVPDADYVRELNEAYQHFFFHYNATPLLVVETSQFEPETSDDALDDLVRQVNGMSKGTRYYVPTNAVRA